VTAPSGPLRADLTGILARIDRAKTHLSDFRNRAQPIVRAGRNDIIREYDDDRSEYIFRLNRVPDIPPALSAIIALRVWMTQRRFGTVTLAAVSYALYALAGLNVLAPISRVAMIGKPRKPVTRSDAIVSVVFCAAVATILVIAAMRLG
jgi:hypothetical protein